MRALEDARALELELREVLNRHSAEAGSDTPDFILSIYLLSCLEAFDQATRDRRNWYRKEMAP